MRSTPGGERPLGSPSTLQARRRGRARGCAPPAPRAAPSPGWGPAARPSPSRRSTPSSRRISVSASRPVVLDRGERATGLGALSPTASARGTASAWTTIALTPLATSACSSAAIRTRSSSIALRRSARSRSASRPPSRAARPAAARGCGGRGRRAPAGRTGSTPRRGPPRPAKPASTARVTAAGLAMSTARRDAQLARVRVAADRVEQQDQRRRTAPCCSCVRKPSRQRLEQGGDREDHGCDQGVAAAEGERREGDHARDDRDRPARARPGRGSASSIAPRRSRTARQAPRRRWNGSSARTRAHGFQRLHVTKVTARAAGGVVRGDDCGSSVRRTHPGARSSRAAHGKIAVQADAQTAA